jgi:hypothetical protein
MAFFMRKHLLLARRWVLRHLVPEIYWPKEVNLDGVTIPLRYRPWSYGTKWLIKQGGYEAEERTLLDGIFQPGMQVIEMGSSIGVLTAIAAEKIGAKGKMVAVEASENLTRHSIAWLSKYPWVTVVTGYAFPVWHARGIAINGFNEERGSLGGTVAFSEVISYDKQAGIFDIETLSSQFNISPELLIVDVEGSERIMLHKPLSFPSTLKSLLIELHPGLYPKGQSDKDAIIKAILNDGFRQVKELGGVYLFQR